jgi:hypothetical protein
MSWPKWIRTVSVNTKAKSSKLRVGDWVEVRSKDEILSTLDSEGCLDGMPFMPEMFAFCGKRFRVYKRAHKTCDTVFPVRGRSVTDAVHLETRCDGSLHGGCEASCLIFWKLAWLQPLTGNVTRNGNPGPSVSEYTAVDAFRNTQTVDSKSGCPKFVCQATQLPYATTNLEWWDIHQYIEDYTSGNVGLGRMISGFVYMIFYALSRAGIGLGRPMRWFYDKFHLLWRGTPFPRKRGTIPDGQLTPTAMLELRPGELVRIKSYEEILKTLNTRNTNRGLYFDAEEVPYCGGEFKVLRRVSRIIDEKTGLMQEMKTPSVILESVICESRYSECRLFCPRSIYPYWREIWLERVKPDASGSGANGEKVLNSSSQLIGTRSGKETHEVHSISAFPLSKGKA